MLNDSSLVIVIRVKIDRARFADLCPDCSLKIMVDVIPKTIMRKTMIYKTKSKNLFIFIKVKYVF